MGIFPVSWSCSTACLAPHSLPGKTALHNEAALAGTKKARATAGLLKLCAVAHHLTSDGSLPPLAASLVITCLCSQMFMLAESLLSPV